MSIKVDMRLPTFYIYFSNKRDVAFNVLSGFGRYMISQMRGDEVSGQPFDAVRASTLGYMRCVERNPGLVRSMIQFADEDPEFRDVYQKLTHDWYLHIQERLGRRLLENGITMNQGLLKIYIAGGMIDQMVRDLYVERNPFLAAQVSEEAPTTDKLAKLISTMWYRAIL